MLEILSPLASANQEGMDVERFTAELSGLAAGRQTLFDEMARLAKPDVELTVSEHADLYRVVSPEFGVSVSRSMANGSRALPARADGVPASRSPIAAGDAEILSANREVRGRGQLVLLHRGSSAGADAQRPS